jgi:hypothetical protein
MVNLGAQASGLGKNYLNIINNFFTGGKPVPLAAIAKPILGFKYVLSQPKLGSEILSPPFLKGDLGGLSGGYLIPPAPL